MRLQEHDGQEISEFFFLSDEEGRGGPSTKPPVGMKLILSYEYHGDHAETWIVFVDGEKEVKRVNTSCVGSIIWSRP